MKLEREAVTFSRSTLGLDWGIGFERAGLQQCYMHLRAERSRYCQTEQDYYEFDEHPAPERRSDSGSQPEFHQLGIHAAAEENHCHDQYERRIVKFETGSKFHDQPNFLLFTAMDWSDDYEGGLYHCQEHHHCQHHRHEGRHQQPESDRERPNVASQGCCVVYSPVAWVEDGSSKVLAEADSPPFFEELLDFPITIMANPSRLVVGYALTAKKAESFLKPALVASARSKGIIFSLIDYDQPLLDQGPFDVILHKITGEVWHQQLKAYKQKNPKVFIFDPPEAIKKVYNRKSMLQEVADLNFQHSQGNVGVPKQLVVDVDSVSICEEVARENLRFPLVAKPLWIDGTTKSHALSLAFNDSGLLSLTTPLVLQEFVNHGGIMFKVFVVGHLIKVVHRPSLWDVCGDEARETGVMAFPRVSSAAAMAAGSDLDPSVIEYPSEGMLSSLAKKLSSRLGLNLFNLDMIRESGKGNQYYVIDINYFPGYGKVPDYENVFTEFLSSLASKRERE